MDHKGDPDKQPSECKENWTKCPYITSIYESMDGERWNCDHCGEYFWLDYEDMK